MSKALRPPSDQGPEQNPFINEPSISNKPPADLPGVDSASKKNKGEGISYVNTFFGWLGELIAEQAQTELQANKNEPSLKETHVVSVRENPAEVLNKAKLIYENLDELKKRLVNEYGGSASSFIIKSIEPMISQARRLIEDLSNPNQQSDSFQDLLQQAIISVELYSQFSDETKLKKKIIQEAHQFTRNSIDKDIEVLANYKRQALEDSSLSSGEKEEQSSKLALFLDPVINELRGIHSSQFDALDLEAFFNWKIHVDERRGALIELGLLTIDALTSTLKTHEVFASELESESEPPDIDAPLIAHQVEEYSLALSFLSTLEDRAMKCLELLERISSDDKESLKLIEQLLGDLNVEAERFAVFETSSPQIRKDLESLKACIQKASVLLTHKQSN